MDRRELLHRTPGDNPAGSRLLLLPPAGAGASLWARFGPGLPHGWSEVLMVCMPGRERQFNKPPFSRIDDAIEAISDAVPSPCDDLVVFGHSLGGLIGFGVVAALERRLQRPLGHLIIAGRVAPSAALKLDLHLASDTALAVAVEKLGGTPSKIFNDPEAWSLYSRALRADFKLAQDWSADRREIIETPMTILSGKSDPATWLSGLQEWQRCARGSFTMHALPGSHFFPFEYPETILRLMRDCSPLGRSPVATRKGSGVPDALHFSKEETPGQARAPRP